MEVVQEHVEEMDQVKMEYGVGHLQCVLVSCCSSSCAGIQSRNVQIFTVFWHVHQPGHQGLAVFNSCHVLM